MILLAGQDRKWLASAVLIASAFSLSIPAAEAGQSSEIQSEDAGGQIGILKREAPVFTYHQFTSLLPPLSPEFEEVHQAGTSSFSLPIRPAFSASAHPVGQEQAGLMGRFGQTVDAVSAQDGLSAMLSEQPELASDEPATTATVAEQQPAPDPVTEQHVETAKAKLIGTGRASWYKHSGRTASGEKYDPNKLTAAHHTLPFGTKVKVVNKRNNLSVVVEITDRTNEHTKAKRNYAIDLSRASAQKLGIEGIGQVALYKVD